METQWYASVAGIVAGTLIIVEVLKRAIGNVAMLKSIPTWVYSVAVAVGLTYASLALGLLTEKGSTLDVLMSALMLAASASGFWTWLRQPADPIKDSEPAIDQRVSRGMFPVVVLAVALTGAVSCGGKNIAPELVATQDAVHDALAAAQDTIEPYCRDPKIEAIRVPCSETNRVLAQALRAGRAYSEAVLSERVAGLGRLVEEVGRLITAVRGIPSREIRVRVVADLQRAIDEAFKGAR